MGKKRRAEQTIIAKKILAEYDGDPHREAIKEYLGFIRWYESSRGYLRPETMKQYTYYLRRYAPRIFTASSDEELFANINDAVDREQNNTARSAFVLYLKSQGRDDGEIKALVRPSFKSKRRNKPLQLTPRDVWRVISAQPEDYRVALAVLFDAALRRSELFALRWKDVRPSELANIQHRVNVIGGKGGKNRTTYLCDERTAQWLEEKRLIDGVVDDEQRVFTFFNQNGEKYVDQGQHLWNYLKKIEGETGFSLHPHLLRHVRATELAGRIPTSALQRMLGHDDIRTTQVYEHLNEEAVEQALNKQS